MVQKQQGPANWWGLVVSAYCLGLTMSPSAQAHYLAVVVDIDMTVGEGRLPVRLSAQTHYLAVVVDVDMALREGRLPTGFLAQSNDLAVVIDIDMAISRQAAKARHCHDGAR